MYRASEVVLIVKFMESVRFPLPGLCFLPCDQGLEFYISLRENSINRCWKAHRTPPRKSTRLSLSLENEQAAAGPDGRTRLTRPNSQARTGIGRKILISLIS